MSGESVEEEAHVQVLLTGVPNCRPLSSFFPRRGYDGGTFSGHVLWRPTFFEPRLRNSWSVGSSYPLAVMFLIIQYACAFHHRKECCDDGGAGDVVGFFLMMAMM